MDSIVQLKNLIGTLHVCKAVYEHREIMVVVL